MSRSRFGLLDTIESIPLETKKRIAYKEAKKKKDDGDNNNQDDNDDKVESNLIEVTYNDLKQLRDENKLITGALYRITDYECTTVQQNTRSAGHQFDIIVTALSESVLSEDAKAIQHSGDTYFSNSNLAAWKLKYCLDNDTNRFNWADSTNGKGVIYQMIDEFNNNCSYDFKNIQFKRYELLASNIVYDEGNANNDKLSYFQNILTNNAPWYIKYGFASNVHPGNDFDFYNPSTEIFEDENYIILDNPLYTDSAYIICLLNPTSYKYFYTFNESNIEQDTSLGKYNNIRDNTIKNGYNTIFFGKECNNNIFENKCDYNTFGYNFCYNKFQEYCSYNNFQNYCHYNTFGYKCIHNILEDSCEYNTFEGDCQNNIFKYSCKWNIFRYKCSNNIFDNSCTHNIFAINSSFNTLGKNCKSNTFGNNCVYNTFGNNCLYNTFGNDCEYNTFGNYCDSNNFGNSCMNIKFGKSDMVKSYYRYIIIDNGNKYIYLYCSATTSNNSPYRNVRIGLGVNNSNSLKTITDSNVNQSYQTEYSTQNDITINV